MNFFDTLCDMKKGSKERLQLLLIGLGFDAPFYRVYKDPQADYRSTGGDKFGITDS